MLLFSFCVFVKCSQKEILKKCSWIETASVKFSSPCQFLVISQPVREVRGNWKETNSPRKHNRKQRNIWETEEELRRPLSAQQALKRNGDGCWLRGRVKSDNTLRVFHSICTFFFTKAMLGKKMYITLRSP